MNNNAARAMARNGSFIVMIPRRMSQCECDEVNGHPSPTSRYGPAPAPHVIDVPIGSISATVWRTMNEVTGELRMQLVKHQARRTISEHCFAWGLMLFVLAPSTHQSLADE